MEPVELFFYVYEGLQRYDSNETWIKKHMKSFQRLHMFSTLLSTNVCLPDNEDAIIVPTMADMAPFRGSAFRIHVARATGQAQLRFARGFREFRNLLVEINDCVASLDSDPSKQPGSRTSGIPSDISVPKHSDDKSDYQSVNSQVIDSNHTEDPLMYQQGRQGLLIYRHQGIQGRRGRQRRTMTPD
jgi:hypothetical protein